MKSASILSDAAEDLDLGKSFYDSHKIVIGEYFVDSLLSDVESLRLFHGIHKSDFGFYRMLSNRFPFGIYYDVTEKEVHVYAVLDLRRDPFWIRSELLGR